MRVLIVYATTEGQTRKIAERIAEQVRERGHEAELRNAADWQSDFHLDAFDRVIVAGSVHERQHQRPLTIFVPAHLAQLHARPTLFVSVSLSAAFPDGLAEAQTYVDEFLNDVKWKPSQVLLAAGALRYEEYDYFMEQIVRFVVLKDREAANAHGDHEFTDWDALAGAVDAFLDAEAVPSGA
jgi:menaquinone-dependent protoporphyrinogen oxidase